MIVDNNNNKIIIELENIESQQRLIADTMSKLTERIEKVKCRIEKNNSSNNNLVTRIKIDGTYKVNVVYEGGGYDRSENINLDDLYDIEFHPKTVIVNIVDGNIKRTSFMIMLYVMQLKGYIIQSIDTFSDKIIFKKPLVGTLQQK